jgi:hypothetical protein
MIHEVVGFIKDQLNQYLKNLSAVPEDRVVFPEGDKSEAYTFTKNAITPLLINLEEENLLRMDEPYVQVRKDGVKVNVYPDIRLNLFVLFVAHFKEYDESLKYLSYVIRYFQSNKVFTQDRTPQLASVADRLVMELVTMPFTSQNEIWNALRTTYLPSVLYKVKMVIFQDEEPKPVQIIHEPQITTVRL